MVSLEIFNDIILPVALRPLGRLSLRQKWVPGVFPGGKGSRWVRLTTLSPSCAVVMRSGNLNFLEPPGPLQACNGTALPFVFDFILSILVIVSTQRWCLTWNATYNNHCYWYRTLLPILKTATRTKHCDQYQPPDLVDCEPDSLDFSASGFDLLPTGLCAADTPASFSSSLSLASLRYSQSSCVSQTVEICPGIGMWPIFCINSLSVNSCKRHRASFTQMESLQQIKETLCQVILCFLALQLFTHPSSPNPLRRFWWKLGYTKRYQEHEFSDF